MPKTYIHKRSRVGRLLTRADKLAAWSRAQAYATGEGAARPRPKSRPKP